MPSSSSTSEIGDTMPVLTFNEGVVMDVMRHECRFGDPVAAMQIRERTRGRMSYDAANRAMKGCVEKGVATKPSRGYYLPTEAGA